jgi:hypothetical protein
MAMDNPRTTAQIAGHPLHPMLVGFFIRVGIRNDGELL